MKSDKISGSRNADGNVPNVNWNDDKLKVNNYNPDNSNDNLRSREEVSIKKIPIGSGFIDARHTNAFSANILSSR